MESGEQRLRPVSNNDEEEGHTVDPSSDAGSSVAKKKLEISSKSVKIRRKSSRSTGAGAWGVW